MLKKLNNGKIFEKVRALIGATALFVLLLSMTAQAAGKTSWLANKDEWPKQTGYHLGNIAEGMFCEHYANDRYYTIALSIEGSGLTPSKTYLKDNFKPKGATSQMSQKYKNQISENKIYFETLNISGINSHMVSSQVAKLKVNGKEIVLAAPYLCPDGYAGYAYFRHYFSYCPNTSEIYYTGTSEHVWLMCTKGERGVIEYHPNAYNHTIHKYYIEPNKYTISYNGNGSTSGSTSSQSATYDEALKLRNNGYKRSGYTFTEWNTKKDGSGTSYNPGKSVKNLTAKDGGKITLYAQWEKASYQLTVKPNGGTWNGKTTDQVFSLKYAATKSIADPTRPGYIFAGWTLSGAGSKLSGKTFTMGSANAVLTAKWTANTYQLTVKPNGGIWNSKTTDQSFAMKYAATKTIADPTRPGYTFAGWTLSGAGSKLSGKTFTMGTANAILTAKWTVNTYQLTVKPNGGTWEGKTDNQNFTMKYAATKTIADPTRTGYTFTGWTVSGTGSSLSGRTFTMGSADAILMANWEANSYTIVFDGNGATGGAMEEMQAFYDQDVQLPANLFVKETEQGISAFTGWNRVPDTFEKEFADGEIIRNLTTENGAVIVLYAIWDDCPMIDASDRFFTLQAAQKGMITEEELLNTAAATDREDITLENRTAAQIVEIGINGSLSLYGYSAADFTGMTDSGSVSMTYKAVDSIGNAVYKTVTIYITNTEPIPQTDFQYTRFINEKYYGASHDAGGLHPESVWLNNLDYKNALQEALQNLSDDRAAATYRFTNEEVIEAQAYINSHGFGKSREAGALQEFYNRFLQ